MIDPTGLNIAPPATVFIAAAAVSDPLPLLGAPPATMLIVPDADPDSPEDNEP